MSSAEAWHAAPANAILAATGVRRTPFRSSRMSYPHFGYSNGMELIFEVRDAEEGGYHAHALGHAIFTEAETWDELRANVLETASLHFEESPVQPRLLQLHYVRDELIPSKAA